MLKVEFLISQSGLFGSFEKGDKTKLDKKTAEILAGRNIVKIIKPKKVVKNG